MPTLLINNAPHSSSEKQFNDIFNIIFGERVIESVLIIVPPQPYSDSPFKTVYIHLLDLPNQKLADFIQQLTIHKYKYIMYQPMLRWEISLHDPLFVPHIVEEPDLVSLDDLPDLVSLDDLPDLISDSDDDVPDLISDPDDDVPDLDDEPYSYNIYNFNTNSFILRDNSDPDIYDVD